MGLFGSKKREDLAENEYYFPLNFFKFVLTDSALLVRLTNKKGKVTNEQVIPYKKITNIEKNHRGGGQYQISIYIDDDRNKKPEITITYKDKKEGEQADDFYSKLQSKLY